VTHSTIGIDFGSSALRAVELSRSGKARPTLLRYHEVPLPTAAISSGEVIEPNTVAAALRQLWAEGGFSTRSVVLGMGNQRVLARDLSVPKASLKRIRAALPFQVQHMLPVPVDEALLDFYPISETTTESGPVVNGLLIAAVKGAVLGNVRAAQLAGLATQEVDLIAFALSRALVSRPGLTGTVAVIDIGAKTTTVVIVVHGVPHFVRIIPTGGDDLSQALCSGLQADALEADRLKRQVGLVPVKALAGQESWVAPPDFAPPAPSHSAPSHSAPGHSAPGHSAPGHSAPTHSVPTHSAHAHSADAHADARGTDAAEIIVDVIGEQLVSLRNTLSYFANTRPKEPVRQIILTGGGAQLPGLAEALADLTGIAVGAGDPLASVLLPAGLDSSVLGQGSDRFTVALGLALGSAS